MINLIKEKLLKYKNIAILGFGREGKSTYKFFRKIMPDKKLTIIDMVNVIEKNDYLKSDKNLEVVFGDTYLDNLDNYDYIMKTPGISLYNIYEDKGNISSQLELILEFYKDQVIGITGTKGKSTTTALIYEAIKKFHDDTFLLGNIGIPLLDYIYDFTDKSILVIEISVQQLMHVNYSPHISLFLNLYLDHLNHVGTKENYYEYKFNIFKYQNTNDFALYNSDDEVLIAELNKRDIKSKKYALNLSEEYFKDNYIYLNGEKIYDWNSERIIKGDHNKYNFLFVFKTLEILGFNPVEAVNVLNNFKGLPHRLQFVEKINGISFYDDTIATIPEAVINGIKSLGDVSTLIMGGSEKGADYKKLIDFINSSSLDNVILQGPVGRKIIDNITINHYYIDDMKEAVDKALEVTSEGKSVLLSPAAASFDKYKDFEEKGDLYQAIIRKEL